MDLISIIVIIAFILKLVKKAEERNPAPKVNKQNPWEQVHRQSSSNSNSQWQQAARENIEKARRRAEDKFREVESEVLGELHKENTYDMPRKNVRTTPVQEQLNLQKENRNAMQQVHAGRVESRNTTILHRAKANAEEDKVDVTLATMEEEHNHSERVAPAAHDHPEDIIPENVLGNIEDLMVKGYDGNLCFERDFVGEAMDMINRFTVPTDIPDFSKDDVA